MVTAIRNIEMALGDGIKRLTPGEAKNKPVVRKSLVASRAIKPEKYSPLKTLPSSGLVPVFHPCSGISLLVGSHKRLPKG